MPQIEYIITNRLAAPQRLHDLLVLATFEAQGAAPCRATLTNSAGAALALALGVREDPNGWFYLAALPYGSPAPYPVLATVAAGGTVTLTISADDFDLSHLADSGISSGLPLRNVNQYVAQTTFLKPSVGMAPMGGDPDQAPWSVQVKTPTGGPFNTDNLSILSSVGGSGGKRRELLPELLPDFPNAGEGMALVKSGGDVRWQVASGEKSKAFAAEVSLGALEAGALADFTVTLPSALLIGTLVQLIGAGEADHIGLGFYSDDQRTQAQYLAEGLAENNWLDDVQGWRYRSGDKVLYGRVFNLGPAASSNLTLRIEGEALA